VPPGARLAGGNSGRRFLAPPDGTHGKRVGKGNGPRTGARAVLSASPQPED
jgi:hypothetical protein